MGYMALTRDEFVDRTSSFYMWKTGLGINIMIMAAMSFIVGLSISGQTFYTFVLENIDKFAALKAMGANNRELVLMILSQAGFTALVGYGLGVGLCSFMITMAKMRLPDLVSQLAYTNLAMGFFMVVLIAGVSSYFGVRRVSSEPFEVFRG